MRYIYRVTLTGNIVRDSLSQYCSNENYGRQHTVIFLCSEKKHAMNKAEIFISEKRQQLHGYSYPGQSFVVIPTCCKVEKFVKLAGSDELFYPGSQYEKHHSGELLFVDDRRDSNV